MTSVNLLTQGIDSLWYWTYSIIVGWGASFTIVVALLIVFTIKLIRLNRRLLQLEHRLITAEREINLALTRFESK